MYSFDLEQYHSFRDQVLAQPEPLIRRLIQDGLNLHKRIESDLDLANLVRRVGNLYGTIDQVLLAALFVSYSKSPDEIQVLVDRHSDNGDKPISWSKLSIEVYEGSISSETLRKDGLKGSRVLMQEFVQQALDFTATNADIINPEELS